MERNIKRKIMKCYEVTYQFQTKDSIAISYQSLTVRAGKKAVQVQFIMKVEAQLGHIATVPKHIHGLRNAANGKIVDAFQKLLLTVNNN